jgi:hypothetical protein
MNRFIEHSHVVTTNKYNSITDFHTTKHSTLELLSLPALVFVTAHNNGFSFTMSSLSVSWQRILHRNYNHHAPDITVLQHT